MTLTELIVILQQLDFDQLTDLMDMVDYVLLQKRSALTRRRGKVAMDEIRFNALQREAYNEFEALRPADRKAAVAVANALLDAKRLKTKRRRKSSGEALAKGSIILKTVKRLVKIKENNVIRFEYVNFGPYLYLRLWATGGEYDPVKKQHKKRLKNYYIGGQSTGKKRDQVPYPYKQLAGDVSSALAGSQDKTLSDEDRKASKDRYKALCAQILECCDISKDPPVIDHDALKLLQASL